MIPGLERLAADDWLGVRLTVRVEFKVPRSAYPAEWTMEQITEHERTGAADSVAFAFASDGEPPVVGCEVYKTTGGGTGG